MSNSSDGTKTMFGCLIIDEHDMLIDLDEEVTKPFSLKYLAEEEKRITADG